MKYGLIGAAGKMGHEIVDVFNQAGHELVFSYDVSGKKFSDTPEVIIDFSLPDAFDATMGFINEYKVPLVIGTTGLNQQQLNKLKDLSLTVPVAQSFNFSIGIQMLLKCTEMLKNQLPDWDVEISETHHRFKKDKPSGTAIMIKNLFNKEVNMSSLRLGNVPGDHTVYFGGLGEVISVSHHATSRRTFAEGVLRSAVFIKDKQKGLYSFSDVLFSNKD